MKSIKELEDEIKVLSSMKEDLKVNNINKTFENNGFKFNYQDFLNEKIHMKKSNLGLAKNLKKREDKKLDKLTTTFEPIKKINANKKEDLRKEILNDSKEDD